MKNVMLKALDLFCGVGGLSEPPTAVSSKANALFS